MQESNSEAWYQASEFARRAGVSVRTLHHYDRLGLLKPRRRSGTGYRLYQLGDLERLEQIVALKFLGLPLADIRKVLDQGTSSLREELGRQQTALQEKRKLIDLALLAISDLQAAASEGKPTADMLRRVIELIEMQNDSNWMMKYYSPEAQQKLADRAKTFTTEDQQKISEDWKEYYRELAALNPQTDPDGKKAAELADRHKQLLAAFTGNDPEVETGLKALYADRSNWPAEMTSLMAEYEPSK